MAHSRDLWLTRFSIVFTLLAAALFLHETVGIAVDHAEDGVVQRTAEQTAFIVIVSLFLYGNLVYQFSRFGYLKRLSQHRPASRDELEKFAYEQPAHPVLFLIPSYREDPNVIRQAMMSAALQEHPDRHVVLLIDDPHDPSDPVARADLRTARSLPARLQRMFDKEACVYLQARQEFVSRRNAVGINPEVEICKLSDLYMRASQWFRRQAASHPEVDHTDRFYVHQVLGQYSLMHATRAADLRRRCWTISADEIEREYSRLAALFSVKLASFERKKYVNLSHEPNKAMNLNSYIGLVGGNYCEVQRQDGLYLERVAAPGATMHVPDADYLITLDADSLLLPGYALRLTHVMERPGNERIAVAQTPYSAIPGARSTMERIAGATTDIQYVIHQGFTHYGATYWVGANAVLRRRALDDIRVMVNERGHGVSVYIQDRTVIEDTESTVDLIARGWSLFNYPERLSYSATPPDFGSLLIQRRRWANGGLIILPKLLRYLVSSPFDVRRWSEGALRIHYLISIAAVNLGLLVLLSYPFEEPMRSWWLPLTALPYFYLYGRDMVHAGYRWLDLPRVYALNLMLVPVNIGGVIKSLQQAISRRKIPFGRTPKIQGRTAAPATYVLAEHGMLLYALLAFAWDVDAGRMLHAGFSLVNGLLFLYVMVGLIGVRQADEDLRLGMRSASRRIMDSRIRLSMSTRIW